MISARDASASEKQGPKIEDITLAHYTESPKVFVQIPNSLKIPKVAKKKKIA